MFDVLTDVLEQVRLAGTVYEPGASPIAYLTRWRMLQAARLLRESPTSVAEVAEKVGYTSEAAFAKAFKRALERTPGEVRRSAPRA